MVYFRDDTDNLKVVKCIAKLEATTFIPRVGDMVVISNQKEFPKILASFTVLRVFIYYIMGTDEIEEIDVVMHKISEETKTK